MPVDGAIDAAVPGVGAGEIESGAVEAWRVWLRRAAGQWLFRASAGRTTAGAFIARSEVHLMASACRHKTFLALTPSTGDRALRRCATYYGASFRDFLYFPYHRTCLPRMRVCEFVREVRKLVELGGKLAIAGCFCVFVPLSGIYRESH